MGERFSCARASMRLDEPLLGTASQVRRWVLVEQPGSWGADALVDSALPPELGEELRRGCRMVGARVLLIRRPAGRPVTGARQVFVASSRTGAGWLEHLEVDDVAELSDLDLGPLAEDGSVGGRRMAEPLLLTCTNGSHDACCAEFGRGVAAALDGELGPRAWECSHIGGDRFAANVLCLPEGVYYGRLTPASAVDVARRFERGHLSLPHYRGRSSWPFDVQAAESLLRHHLGDDRIEGVVPRARRATGPGLVEVDLAVDGRDWRVVLEVAADPVEQRLTCTGPRGGHPPRYTEVGVRRLDRSEGTGGASVGTPPR